MSGEGLIESRRGWVGHGTFVCLFAAVVMSYGWRYRGTVGHEGGAMVPGAMLGLAACVASGRSDWYRRAMVAGLCGAIGFAWGGSLSYMEQTFYLVTDSFLDVLYGCSVLFFLGGLWAGIGGAILGLALSLPRSRLQRLVGPLVAISVAFLATYLFFFFNPEWRDTYSRYTAEHFHDADWFPALTVIVVSGLYALFRPKERSEARLFLACGIAWWIGYLTLTKFGGLSLGPPYRSEGWGGVLGIFVVVLVYLWRQQNRAALALGLYGILAGGVAFAASYSILRSRAEESVGFFMGLGMGLGFLQLERGGLAPAAEDTPARPLDLFSLFVMVLPLMWINLRRTPMSWLRTHASLRLEPVAGVMPWVWFFLCGVVLTTLVTYGLYLYGKHEWARGHDRRNASIVLLLLVWVTLLASVVQARSDSPGAVLSAEASLILFAFLATAMLIPWLIAGRTPVSTAPALAPTDPHWHLSMRYGVVCASMPVLLLMLTWASLAKQDGPAPHARKRFGPDAYWRQITQVVGKWEVVGLAHVVGGEPDGPAKDAPETLELKGDRSVVAMLPGGVVDPVAHAWQHRDSVVWLEWYGRKGDPPQKASLPMALRNGRLYIAWPPKSTTGSFATYRKAGNQ
jgi:hypothetical protein